MVIKNQNLTCENTFPVTFLELLSKKLFLYKQYAQIIMASNVTYILYIPSYIGYTEYALVNNFYI